LLGHPGFVVEAAGGTDGRILHVPHDLVVSPAHEKRVVVDVNVGAAKAQRLELVVLVLEGQARDGVIAPRDPEDISRPGDGNLAGRLGADVDGIGGGCD
jgi:hypothetical protein